MQMTTPECPVPVEDEFLDLVLSDPGLLRAEFEAIIGASWTETPDPPTSPASGPPALAPDGGERKTPWLRPLPAPEDHRQLHPSHHRNRPTSGRVNPLRGPPARSTPTSPDAKDRAAHAPARRTTFEAGRPPRGPPPRPPQPGVPTTDDGDGRDHEPAFPPRGSQEVIAAFMGPVTHAATDAVCRWAGDAGTARSCGGQGERHTDFGPGVAARAAQVGSLGS